MHNSEFKSIYWIRTDLLMWMVCFRLLAVEIWKWIAVGLYSTPRHSGVFLYISFTLSLPLPFHCLHFSLYFYSVFFVYLTSSSCISHHVPSFSLWHLFSSLLSSFSDSLYSHCLSNSRFLFSSTLPHTLLLSLYNSVYCFFFIHLLSFSFSINSSLDK